MAFIKQEIDNLTHEVPKHGPLQNLKVVFSAVQTAGPWGPHLLAEWGADVIWLEYVKYGGDQLRSYKNSCEIDHRNERSMALDIFAPEGMEIFKKLVEDADIFLVGGKGPNFTEKGITDDFLWAINPQLTICRLSGYGQDGDKDYIYRPCFDGIAQADTGFMSQNGMPGGPPIPSYPYACDMYSALFCCASMLAGVVRARETGKGESIDVAMTEVLLRIEGPYNFCDYLNDGILYPQPGDKDPMVLAEGVFKAKDGYLLFNVLGAPQVKQFMTDIGCEELYGTEDYPVDTAFMPRQTPHGEYVSQKIDEWCLNYTVDEIAKYMEGIGAAYAPVLRFPDVPNHPQYNAREMFVNYDTMEGEDFKAINIVPRFNVNPTKIWRAMPKYGYDTVSILEGLGYGKDQIDDLFEKRVINDYEHQ